MTVVESDRDLCVDCGVNCFEAKEYYMVSDACWKRAGMKPYDGFLCIGCLEERLGEKLKSVNFKECPLNWRNIILPEHGSHRLISRMLGNGRSKWRVKTLEGYKKAVKGNWTMIEQLTLTSLNDGGV